MKKHIILFLFLGLPFLLKAVPVITTVNTTPIVCNNDGKIEIIATGTAPIYYGLIAPSTVERVDQTSNIFENLPPGSYTVAVYDKDQPNEPVTRRVTVSGSSYNAVKILSTSTSTYVPPGESRNCVEIGRITVRVSGGRGGYSYEVVGPVTKTGTFTSAVVNIDDLPSGSYTVKISDCGSSATSGALTVTSSGAPLKGKPSFTSISAAATVDPNCGNTSIMFTSIVVNGVSIGNYPSIRYRVIYDDVPTGWGSVNNDGNIYGITIAFKADVTKYYVEVEHPCTGDIIKSGAYNISIVHPAKRYMYDYVKFNPCTGTVDSVCNMISMNDPGYKCAPYTITLNTGGGTVEFSEMKYFPAGAYYTLTSVKDKSGAPTTVGSSGRFISYTQPINTAYQISTVTDNDMPANNCDYSKVLVYVKPNFFVPKGVGDGGWYWNRDTEGYMYPTTIKAKLISGPDYENFPDTTLTDITYSGDRKYKLWNNMPVGGTYTVELEVSCEKGTCTFTRNFTTKADLKAFTSTDPVPASTCGIYSITGKGYFTNANNTINTTDIYQMALYRLDNTPIYGKSAGAYSNANAVITGVSPGDYILKYTHKGCVSKDYPITLPEYNTLSYDYKLSGGITCNLSTATLYAVATGGTGTKYYRIKKKGDPDANYSASQTSNSFSRPKGDYTVEIKDDCGTITPTITVQDGTQQFVSIIGAISEGVVCEGKPVTLAAYSIGRVTSYQWYKDDIAIPGANENDYTIPSASLADIGKYRIDISTGVCPLSSEYIIHTVSAPTEKPVISGTNSLCTGSVTLIANITATSPSYIWYKDGVEIAGKTGRTISISEVGNYTVVAIPAGACASLPSDPHEVNNLPPQAPIITNEGGEYCSSGTRLVIPQISGATYQWYKDGVAIPSSNRNVLLVRQLGDYSVMYKLSATCESPLSAIVNIPYKNCLVANDYKVSIFDGDSVTIDILSICELNGLVPGIVLSSPTTTYGEIKEKSRKLDYKVTPLGSGGKIDVIDYKLVYGSLYSEARIFVYILNIPKILLKDECSSKPSLQPDMNYTGATYSWSFSANGTSGWVSKSTNAVFYPTETGWYKMSVTREGSTKDVIVKFTILKSINIQGNKWYETKIE